MEKGKLIVIEGACDGMGKSTQHMLLRKKLVEDGYMVNFHHFPSYGTYHGTAVEKYLMGDFGSPEDTTPFFINSLYANDRAIAWYSNLKLNYDQGHIILLDRYTTSSLIYQSSVIKDRSERIDFIEYICDYEYNKLGIKEPDQVIFLYASFEVAQSLLEARSRNDGVANDIHERNLEFLKRVYDNAMFIADYFSWDKVDCSDGKTLKSMYEIHDDVYKLTQKTLKKSNQN